MNKDNKQKECAQCWVKKPIEEFTPQPSGKHGRHSYCRACMREYRNRWNQTPKGQASNKRYAMRRKDEWVIKLNDLKTKAGCHLCGYREDPLFLNYVHRAGTENKFQVRYDAYVRAPEAITEEIAKCDVVCVYCHGEYLNERRQPVRFAKPHLDAKYVAFAEWLDSIKTMRGCTDCGFNRTANALEFDHLPQHERLFSVNRSAFQRPRWAVEAEMAKCEVVCSGCHRRRTMNRKGGESGAVG